MDWTGGSLQRCTSSTRNIDRRKQKAHFARKRPRLVPNPSVTTDTLPVPTDSNTLADRKHRLLDRPDWLELSVTQPLHQYPTTGIDQRDLLDRPAAKKRLSRSLFTKQPDQHKYDVESDVRVKVGTDAFCSQSQRSQPSRRSMHNTSMQAFSTKSYRPAGILPSTASPPELDISSPTRSASVPGQVLYHGTVVVREQANIADQHSMRPNEQLAVLSTQEMEYDHDHHEEHEVTSDTPTDGADNRDLHMCSTIEESLDEEQVEMPPTSQVKGEASWRSFLGINSPSCDLASTRALPSSSTHVERSQSGHRGSLILRQDDTDQLLVLSTPIGAGTQASVVARRRNHSNPTLSTAKYNEGRAKVETAADRYAVDDQNALWRQFVLGLNEFDDEIDE